MCAAATPVGVKEITWSKKDSTRPVSVRWVHTIFDEFLKNPDLITAVPIKGQRFMVPFLNAEFSFDTRKLSPDILTVTCYRQLINPALLPDNGYFLRFYFTISGIDQETICAVMRSTDNHVSVDYLTRLFKDDDKLYFCTLKCCIRMIEVSALRGYFLTSLDNDLKNYHRKYEKPNLKNMAFLLKRKKFRDIFTARESPTVLAAKSRIIDRTLKYAKKIADYLKAKEQPDPNLEELPLGRILCHIHTGENRVITEAESLDLILKSYETGMHFIYEITSDFIIANLNKAFVVQVLKCAVVLSDRKLFKAASDFFLMNRAEVLQSEEWKKFSEEYNKYCRVIIHDIQMQQANENAYVPPGIFEETTEL